MDKDDEQRLKPVVDTTRVAPAATEGSLMRPWTHLGRQLVPLIGETGFCALFSRAARLAGPASGSLVLDPACRAVDPLLSALADHLVRLDGARAPAANAALLDTFTKLLSALIGEGLTTRLLASASNDDEGQGRAQEHRQ
jgi:hypothetical protein